MPHCVIKAISERCSPEILLASHSAHVKLGHVRYRETYARYVDRHRGCMEVVDVISMWGLGRTRAGDPSHRERQEPEGAGHSLKIPTPAYAPHQSAKEEATDDE